LQFESHLRIFQLQVEWQLRFFLVASRVEIFPVTSRVAQLRFFHLQVHNSYFFSFNSSRK
jgi:hypothetical protein